MEAGGEIQAGRRLDVVLGILIGIVLGIGIVAAFVFLGSEDAIDAPRVTEPAGKVNQMGLTGRRGER